METRNQHQDNLFDNVISSYTQEQAIEDGILVEVGKLTSDQKVVFTRNLFETGGYEEEEPRIHLIERGINLLRKSDPEDTEYMKLRVIEKDRIWVIADGNGLTFMRPEDY